MLICISCYKNSWGNAMSCTVQKSRFLHEEANTVGNFFGGVVIIMEKPFTIGDWIETKIVTGTVEDISFRSTKVRTAGEALVTVPNSVLANEAIMNWTKMRKRQVTFTLVFQPYFNVGQGQSLLLAVHNKLQPFESGFIVITVV